jgi:hypothetical protein
VFKNGTGGGSRTHIFNFQLRIYGLENHVDTPAIKFGEDDESRTHIIHLSTIRLGNDAITSSLKKCVLFLQTSIYRHVIPN